MKLDFVNDLVLNGTLAKFDIRIASNEKQEEPLEYHLDWQRIVHTTFYNSLLANTVQAPEKGSPGSQYGLYHWSRACWAAVIDPRTLGPRIR